MKIARIEQYKLRYRCQLVKVTTDTGIEGWGETTLEGKLDSARAAVDELGEYLIGKDPLRIEHHWQSMYRSAFNRGGPQNMAAISGIEQALYDIAGKHFGVPAYWLLGGPTRERIKVYAHCSLTDFERMDRLIKEKGYAAIKSGPPGAWHALETPQRTQEFADMVWKAREHLGWGVDIALDFHGKMTPAQAIRVCRALEEVAPLFVEEPIPQENADALAVVARATSIPIATGERLLTRWGFRDIVEKQAVAILQPDLARCGGLLETKKIAAHAEMYYMHLAPHAAIGPVQLAACLQVDACIPNFLIQEQVDRALGWGILKDEWVVTNGYIELPQRPGLGFEIDEEALQTGYEDAYALPALFYEDDGSVADW